MAVEVAETARAWGSQPSRVLGLPAGSLAAFVVDRDLAVLMVERARAADAHAAGKPEHGGGVVGGGHPGSGGPPDGPWMRGMGDG